MTVLLEAHARIHFPHAVVSGAEVDGPSRCVAGTSFRIGDIGRPYWE
jgi:hypothetical protein